MSAMAEGRLAGKVAAVTGGAQGIGRAIVEEMAREGARVAFLDRNEAAGRAAQSELGKQNLAVLFCPADVTDERQVERAFALLAEEAGPPDILVNNAGGNTYLDPVRMSAADWDAALALNLKSAWLCARAALPAMLSRRAGVIVNISSLHARMTAPGMFPYAAAKAGLAGLTRSVALEYGPAGIRVNAILPGWTLTPPVEQWLARRGDAAAERRRLEAAHPLRRIATAREVARVAVFLASDDSSAITGAEIVADCGLSAKYAGQEEDEQ